MDDGARQACGPRRDTQRPLTGLRPSPTRRCSRRAHVGDAPVSGCAEVSQLRTRAPAERTCWREVVRLAVAFAVAALRQLVEELEELYVDNARRLGWSWQAIATGLGVTANPFI